MLLSCLLLGLVVTAGGPIGAAMALRIAMNARTLSVVLNGTH